MLVNACMKSRWAGHASLLAFSVGSFGLFSLAACGNSADDASAAAAGSGGTATAGATPGGASTTGGAGATTDGGGAATGGSGASMTGGAGAATGGGSANGGSAVAGGSGAGGQSSGGQGGTTSGGTSAGGGGAGGNQGGSTGCVGRSLSLSSNGTGSDSDAAQAEVVIDLMDALPIGNAKRTVELWAYIKSTDWVGEKNEVYYYGMSGTATTFGLDFGTNPVMGTANHATLNPFTGGGAFTVDSTADLGVASTADQWVHIAMTWDGAAVRTYVNAKLGITANASGSTTMLATLQGPLIMGCNPENKGCFNGLFDELRVWNVARTDAELMASYKQTLIGDEAGLVGYWKFDDAVGSTTAADSLVGGTGHVGTLKASAANQLPTFVTPPAPLPVVCP